MALHRRAKAEAFANELLCEMADKGLPTPDTDEGEGDEDADEQKARAICERLGMDDDDIDDPTVRAAILELGEHDAAIMQSLIQDHDGKTLGVAFYALCTISDPLLDMADYPYEREHKEPYLDLKKAALR
jgi:hypothetical protein